MIVASTQKPLKAMNKIARILLVLFIVFTTYLTSDPGTVLADGELSMPAEMNKRFTPDNIPMGDVSTLEVDIYNPNYFALTLSTVPAAWTDTLPDGITFADPLDATTTCGGIVSTSGQTISLVGGTVPAQVGTTPGSCVVTVKVTSLVPGNHTNTIPASALHASDPTGTILITNTSPVSHTLEVNDIQPPAVSKSFSPNTQWVGQNSQLNIHIRNTDLNYPLTEVSISDNLPSGVQIANTTTSFSNCGTGVTITGPGGVPLAAGQTSIIISEATIPASSDCLVRVNVTSSTPGVYVNSIPAGAVHSHQSLTNQNAASATVNFQAIGLEKTFSPSNFEVGGTGILRMTLKNPSGSDYTGVSLTDNLPAGLTISSPPVSPQCDGTITYTASSLTINGGVIPAGTVSDPGECIIEAQVTSSIPGSYTNTIPANAISTDQLASNVMAASANINVYDIGDGITGSKRFNPSTIAVNGTSRLTVNLRAPADSSLTNFSVYDALPAGVRVAATPNASSTANCVGGVYAPSAGDTYLTYSGGTIPAGQQCSLSVDVTSAEEGSFNNVISPANISNSENRNISSNISATLTVSGISVAKAFYPQSVGVNGISTLTIELTNTNLQQLDELTFIDSLPGGVVVADDPAVSTTCAGALVTAVAGESSVSVSNGSVPAQVGSVTGICTVTLDVKGTVTGTHTNQINAGAVTAKIHGTDTVISNPSRARADLTVEDLTIAVQKTFDPITVFGGSTSTLTVRLHNPNNAALVGISFTDDMPQSTDPAGGISIAASPQVDTGTCGGVITAVPGSTSFSYSGGSLGANESCELTLKVTMDVSGSLINTIAESSVTTTNGASNPQPASATLTNLAGASLTKYFLTNTIQVGETSTLTIRVQNTSNVSLSGLGFTDDFPAGVTVATDPDAAQCGGTVSFTPNSVSLEGGTLAAEEYCDVSVILTSTSSGSYENCIDAGALSSDQDATNADQTCDTLLVEGTLAPPVIAKEFLPNPLQLGETATLTFTITNPNDIALQGVAFDDALPSGLTVASLPNVDQCNGTVSSTADAISFTGGEIAANSSCEITVGVNAAAAGDYVNTTGSVSSTNGGTGNTATDTLQVIAPPLIAKQFSPDTISAGGTTTLTFTISNPAENTLALTGVSFIDTFPVGVQRASDPLLSQCGGTVTSTSNSVRLVNGTIDVGDSCTVSIEVTAPNAGTFDNLSQVVDSSNGGTGNTASDSLTVTGVGLSLLKTSLSANYQQAGDSVTYSYLLTNTGDETLYAPFVISDDHFSSDFNCGTATELAPGADLDCTAQYTVTAADVTAKSITNLATASAQTSGGADITSNESNATVYLAALTLQKSTSTSSYTTAGNSISYIYVLTNSGRVTLYPPYQVIDDHFGSAIVCSSTTSLVPGAVTSCSATYTVTADDVTAGSVTNHAYATALDAASGGSTVTSNSDDATVYKTVPPVITKDFSPGEIAVGNISELVFTITNNNDITLTNVGFVDDLPADITPALDPLASQCGGTVSYSSSNNRITLTGGSIVPHNSCTVSVYVSSDTSGDFVNTSNAVTSGNGGTGNTAQATLTVVASPLISKSFDPISILAGQTSTLTITITNPPENTRVLNGVAFVDDLPTNMKVAPSPSVTLTDCGSPLFSPVADDTTLNFSNGSIAVGGSCVVTLSITAPTGTYENTTQPVVSVNGGDGAESNTANLDVEPATDLAITKSDGKLAVDRNEGLTYQVQVSNLGPTDVVGARVFDAFPSSLNGVTWVCTADAGATCTASGSGDIDDTVNIPSGSSILYTISATVASDTDTDVLNSASVVPPAGLVDTNYDNNVQSDTDHINRLQVEKNITEANYNENNQILHYSYLVTNIGTSTLVAPFTLNDDLAATTCVFPATLAPTENFTCTGTYNVTWADLNAGSITNHVTATARDADGDEVNSNQDELTVNASQEPLIGVAKQLTRVEEISAGSFDVTYTILVKNYGNVALQNVQAADDLVTTFPLPTTFSVKTIQSADFIVNSSFDGDGQPQLLDTGNSLAAGEQGTITLTVNVIPTSSGPYNNVITVSAEHPTTGTITDDSQNGSNPDPDGDGDPTNNDEPTQVDFGATLLDPPYGTKSVDASGKPVLTWTMVWINNTNIVDINGIVHDPIPLNTTFSPTTVDSGYPVPAGAPAGSTSLGVTCTSSVDTITELCYYEGPTPGNDRGQIIWKGSVAPDFGVSHPAVAVNALTISFNVLLDNDGIDLVNNVATIDVDRNGDGDFTDSAETAAAIARRNWDANPSTLPATGFAPGRITLLPSHSEARQYDDLTGLRLKMPVLGIDIPIMGIPQMDDGNWDLTWLSDQAGWLNGTAFPTWAGNSVLTGHLYLPDGNPGPFIDLKALHWGDLIEVQAYGQTYVYEVREIHHVDSADTTLITAHEEYPWLTLLTCEQYDEQTNTYHQRLVVRAVQVEIK
ncbi:MAG: class F sortase [Chloroflexi bacterium]|nr:class F sortase [Chloroflexota bacterium]